MRTDFLTNVALGVLLLVGCAPGQVGKDSSDATTPRDKSGTTAGANAKAWQVKNRRGTFVFSEGTGKVTGGYLSMGGLAHLDRKLSIENFGESYFSKVDGYKSVFFEYGRKLSPTLIKIRGDRSSTLVVEPLTKEDLELYGADAKQLAANQLFFDGQVGDFLARPGDKLILASNGSVTVKAFKKTWELKFAENGLGEVTVGPSGFVCGSGVTCTAGQP